MIRSMLHSTESQFIIFNQSTILKSTVNFGALNDMSRFLKFFFFNDCFICLMLLVVVTIQVK